MTIDSVYVSMREYMAASKAKQQSLVPDIPALYYWIVDFGGPARNADECTELLRAIPG